jgi:hypothetical protein
MSSVSLPQFDPSFYGSQIFWLCFCLLVVFIFARFIFVPFMEEHVSKPINEVDHMMDRIQELSLQIDVAAKEKIVHYKIVHQEIALRDKQEKEKLQHYLWEEKKKRLENPLEKIQENPVFVMPKNFSAPHWVSAWLNKKSF